MSTHTDESIMDDADLIEILKRAGRQPIPMASVDIDALTRNGRHVRRRRRLLMVPVSSLAIVGLAALVFAATHVRSGGRQFFIAPAGLAAQQTHQTFGNHPDTNYNYMALQAALGDDFVVNPYSVNPGGNVTVRAGSPSAQGLPTGLTVWTQILVFQQSPQSGELAQFCKPLVEKNTIFSACTTQMLADGRTVYVQKSHTGPGGVKPGRSADYLASDGVRVLFEQQHGGNLVIVDLSTQENESSSTPERRAAAQTWLDGITPRLVTAATDPGVSDAAVRTESKPSASR